MVGAELPMAAQGCHETPSGNPEYQPHPRTAGVRAHLAALVTGPQSHLMSWGPPLIGILIPGDCDTEDGWVSTG